MRTKLGPYAKFNISSLINEVSKIYGIAPSSIAAYWSRALDRTSNEAYRKMMSLCDGNDPTLKRMSDYFAKKYNTLV